MGANLILRGSKGSRKRSLLSAYTADLGQLVSRRKATQALRAAGIESALANRAKSEFLANMSHELRTPLHAIIGFAELVNNLDAAEMTSGKPREFAGHISQAGKRLLSVVNDVLNISNIDSGKMSLDVRAHLVQDVVDSAVQLVSARFAERKQMFTAHVAEGLPEFPMDGARIKQVLINLLSNASKFTPDEGKILLIVTSGDNDSVTFAVSDTGRGMTQDEISRAMRPFSQVQSSYARDHEGIGLGLTLARALVLQHGGDFHISSEPRVGTSVVFTLPGRRKTEETSAHDFAGREKRAG